MIYLMLINYLMIFIFLVLIYCVNLLIEFNGEQHYYPIDYYGGEEAFKLQKKHDKMKKQYAKNNNIDLLIISYLEFKNINTILEEKWQKVQAQL